MGIDNVRYRGWHGTLRNPWWTCTAIVRVALLQVFRRKSYWVVLGIAALHFLLFWAVIYAVTQMQLPRGAEREMLRGFGFDSTAAARGEDDGYIRFMEGQSIAVMILLAFSGSLLVGSDFRLKSLPFYLSRRMDKRHYIVGKLLAVATIVALVTVVPAILLFIEFGMFTSSLDYWLDNWRILLGVLAYGLVLCTVLSVLLVTTSAYLQKMAPIAITWSSLFIMLGRLSAYLESAYDDRTWILVDPWRDMRLTGRLIFGVFATEHDRQLAIAAALLLTATCILCLVALVHRVRAVDVVE